MQEQQESKQPNAQQPHSMAPVGSDLPPAAAKSDAPIVLSFDEAVKLLPEGDSIHTFRNPRAGMMFGADWRRAEVIDAMRASPVIQVTGKMAQAMRHGIVINNEGGLLFIEAANFEPEAA